MSNSFNEIIGGKWWKVDFHLHTPGSYDYGHGDESLQSMTPEEFLRNCMEKELDCIVVSDHETFKWVPELRNAQERMRTEHADYYREIVIFPGIEINTQGNVHLLGIFDPSTSYEKLCEIFGKLGINEELRSTNNAPNIVMEEITKNGGIAIPAHVDDNSGLFGRSSRLPPEPDSVNLSSPAPATIIKNALNVNELLALEVLGEGFHNGLFDASHRKVSFVVGSDSHTPDTIAQRFTWVKMGVPSIEALRLALFDTNDGTIRDIEITGNPNDLHGKTYLKKLEIKNGRYIGRPNTYEVNFSPWLNCLIGGRGSGKSSIITFARMVLGRGDELPQKMQSEYSEFVKFPKSRNDLGMLFKSENDTTEVKLEVVVDGVGYTLRWFNNQVEEWNEELHEWTSAVSLKERFPIRMFSQKQLFEMTSDSDLLLSILDDKWNSRDWKRRLKDAVDLYNECAKRKIRIETKIREKEKLNTLLVDLNKKIAVFENEESRTILSQKTVLQNNKEKVLKVLKPYIERVDYFKKFIEMIDECCSEDLNGVDENTCRFVTEWIGKERSFESAIKGIYNGYRDVFINQSEFIDSLPITHLISHNAAEIQSLMNRFATLGVNVNQYGDFLRDRDGILEQLHQIGDVENDLLACNSEIESRKEDINSLIRERYDSRIAVINEWNQIGTLRITLNPFADIQKNEKSFRSIIRKDLEFTSDILDFNDDGSINDNGILAPMLKAENFDDALRKMLLLKETICETGGKKFQKYLTQLFSNNIDAFNEFITWVPEDKLQLELKIENRGRTTYKSIDAGSPGQRTSAVLSLILGISEMPIIIDQPEDDLDTRNITDIIVRGIEKLKKKQQIILVTHNPNIVVNSNSELVTQLDYINGQIQNVCSGALQEHSVRDAICEVMEGGKEALEKRYYRIFKALAS